LFVTDRRRRYQKTGRGHHPSSRPFPLSLLFFFFLLENNFFGFSVFGYFSCARAGSPWGGQRDVDFFSAKNAFYNSWSDTADLVALQIIMTSVAIIAQIRSSI